MLGAEMEILYISSVMADEVNNQIKKDLKQPTEYSIQKFHSLILNGLNDKDDVNITVLSGLPISRSKSSKIWWKKRKIEENSINYIHLPFFNIPILKQLFICIGMFIETIKWNCTKKNKYIICDSAYMSVTPIIIFLSKIFRVKTTAIVADIYDYMSDEIKVSKKSIIRLISKKIAYWVFSNYNNFILLTEAMNNIVNKKNKPYIIMEGLVDSSIEKSNNNIDEKYKEKVCMYAGGINERYGVKNLIEAFMQINIENAQLHIYGIGDLKEYIEKINNDKIKYFGAVDNKKIIEEEKKVWLLINPRFSNEEYTKFSFPSKIMEYMSSGTPVLTTRLPGIPEEYNEYLWYIENEDVQGMKNSIEDVLKKDINELYNKGKISQEFVLKEKNNIVQAKRIINMMKE